MSENFESSGHPSSANADNGSAPKPVSVVTIDSLAASVSKLIFPELAKLIDDKLKPVLSSEAEVGVASDQGTPTNDSTGAKRKNHPLPVDIDSEADSGEISDDQEEDGDIAEKAAVAAQRWIPSQETQAAINKYIKNPMSAVEKRVIWRSYPMPSLDVLKMPIMDETYQKTLKQRGVKIK